MKNVVKLITVQLLTEDAPKINEKAVLGSLFMPYGYRLEYLRMMSEIHPDSQKDKSLGELWHDVPPLEDGQYKFEIGTELPFFLPGLGEMGEKLFQVGDYDLSVCNSMVRAYIGEGEDDKDRLPYYLLHRKGLKDFRNHKAASHGFHAVPMRTFVSHQYSVSGNTPESIIETNLKFWQSDLVAATSKLIDTIRERVPEKAIHLKSYKSITSYPVFWIVISGKDDIRGCEQFSGSMLLSSAKPVFSLESDEIEDINTQLKLGKEIALVHQILLSATSDRFYGNFDQALIQICTACEIAISIAFVEYLKKQGTSNTSIDTYVDDFTFSQLLNIQLGIIVDKKPDNYSDIVGKINWARKRRNEIVHKGESSQVLTEKDIIDTISAAETLIGFPIRPNKERTRMKGKWKSRMIWSDKRNLQSESVSGSSSSLKR